MQNVQGLSTSSASVAVEKFVESASGSDVIKKLQSAISQPRETECRVPRVTRDQAIIPNQSEKQFQATIVADKYLLLDQVEGSSLYRCMDVNTQEELVCKVSCEIFFDNAILRWTCIHAGLAATMPLRCSLSFQLRVPLGNVWQPNNAAGDCSNRRLVSIYGPHRCTKDTILRTGLVITTIKFPVFAVGTVLPIIKLDSLQIFAWAIFCYILFPYLINYTESYLEKLWGSDSSIISWIRN